MPALISQIIIASPVLYLEQVFRRIVPVLQLFQIYVFHFPPLCGGLLVTLGHEEFPGAGVTVQTPRIATVYQPVIVCIVPPGLVPALSVTLEQQHWGLGLVLAHIKTDFLPAGWSDVLEQNLYPLKS